jgi:hypothetical protein
MGSGDVDGLQQPEPSVSDVAGVVLRSEFAAVRVSVDRRAHGPRLLIEDLEDGTQVHLDPLALSSFCHADDEEQVAWLLVGPYRDQRR